MTYWTEPAPKALERWWDAPLPKLTPDDITIDQCRGIWNEIILRTFREAEWEEEGGVGPRYYVEHHNMRAVARIFLRGTSEHFHLICQAADVSPSVIRQAAIERFGSSLYEPGDLIDLKEAAALLSAFNVG